MKYIHFRNFKADGSISDKGGLTIGWERINDTYIRVAAAKCAPKDCYHRSMGRTIVDGRMNKGKYTTLPATRQKEFETIANHFYPIGE